MDTTPENSAQTADKATSPTPTPATPPVPRRGPGHRGADVRDTVAEMAAKAQEISMEAGSKMAGAMKDVINAAAGLTGFVVESARDLVQYMVRRGQMTQEEADRLIREAEEHHGKRKVAPTTPGKAAEATSVPAAQTAKAVPPPPKAPAKKSETPTVKAAAKKAPAKAAAKPAVTKKAAAKAPAKTPAKAPAKSAKAKKK